MNASFQLLVHSNRFNIRFKSVALACHFGITAIKLCKCTPLTRLDCWGWASRLIEPLWLISVNLITVGVVSISPVVIHYLPLSLPQSLSSPSALLARRGGGFWEQQHCLKPNHRWGFLRLLEFPLNRRKLCQNATSSSSHSVMLAFIGL